MKPGYYLIKHLGFLVPARWDGDMWHHEYGTSFPQPEHKNVVKGPIVLDSDCPVGCTCTVNPNGSIHVKCIE